MIEFLAVVLMVAICIFLICWLSKIKAKHSRYDSRRWSRAFGLFRIVGEEDD